MSIIKKTAGFIFANNLSYQGFYKIFNLKFPDFDGFYCNLDIVQYIPLKIFV